MNTSGFLNTTFRVDQFCLALRQQASHLLEHSIEELFFRDGFDNFAFAEENATALATGQTNIGITRLTGAVDNAAHDSHMNRRLHFSQSLLYLVGDTDDIDL